MNQNNLDKLFQEQLKNLEATPNKKVWNNIESKLKKKKRRVVPFWWFGSGVAAMLLVSFLLFTFSDNETDLIKTDSKIIITETPKKQIEIIYQPKEDTVINKKHIKDENIILVADKTLVNSIKNTSKANKSVNVKKAMKEVYLANNSFNKTTDSIKKSTNSNNGFISDKKEENGKQKTIEPKGKSTKNKVDLNKMLEEKDSVFSVKALKNKWSITPVFAVLKSNSFSNSSPINEGLSKSTKGENSFSYGFQVGYQINKKWSIQSGIHLQEISFANNQVNAVSTISENSSSISFNNGASLSFNDALIQNSDFSNTSSINRTTLSGDLNQKYGYIEIPVEVKYNFLSTKKINTEVVAGFSSLFLNKNEINFNTQLVSQSGEANNLNNINFSGNLGFDFNYSLNKKWSLNVNPMFKVQLNTFSEDSNGFSPFNLGVYSGIKYKF